MSSGAASAATPEAATVVVLGSTGSIGRQTLKVISDFRGRFRVVGLSCDRNVAALADQVAAFGVDRVAVNDSTAAREARDRLPASVEVLDGPSAATELAAAGADIVVNGMVSSRGLPPTLAALRAGSRLALANKESLVVGGPLVKEAAREADQIVPVDSEHSALAQCLRAGTAEEVRRLILTASGGPFRGWSRDQLAGVTVQQALSHPTWRMGPVITVGSATLANKGLEVIEAHLLFDIAYDRIDVTVHPQSIVHSMVEFCDGAVIAKMSPPDMRLPIQLALSWPERLPLAHDRLDLTSGLTLEFEPVDADVFGMVNLARAAGMAGETTPAVFNAANEEAVAAFLEGRLSFPGITEVVEAVLEVADAPPARNLETVLDVEQRARDLAHRVIVRR